MTPPDDSRDRRKPVWIGPAAAGAVGVLAAIAGAIYLGLVARGNAWPLFVLAVASAPLALLAVTQGVQAVVGLGRRERGRWFSEE